MKKQLLIRKISKVKPGDIDLWINSIWFVIKPSTSDNFKITWLFLVDHRLQIVTHVESYYDEIHHF